MKSALFATLAAVAVLAGASAANAATYLLNVSEAQSALPAPYGQVDITNVTGGVDLTVTLFNGLKLTDTGAHYAFSFNLNGASGVTLQPKTGFSLVSSSNNIANSPFGGFDYGIACSTCAPNTGGYAAPVTFRILGTGVTEAAFNSPAATLYQGQSVLFAADTIASSGVTGTIGGLAPVPEPATWALMIGGFGAAGAMLRRRRMQTIAI